MKALLIDDDATMAEVELGDESGNLADLYRLIGCRLVDVVAIEPKGRHLDMWVDDEGALTGRPLNILATIVAGRPIVGHVVVAGCDAGEMRSVSRKDVRAAAGGGAVLGPSYSVDEVVACRADGNWWIAGKGIL